MNQTLPLYVFSFLSSKSVSESTLGSQQHSNIEFDVIILTQGIKVKVKVKVKVNEKKNKCIQIGYR